MVASSIDVEKEKTVHVKEEVNSGSYLARHNAQMFQDGRSFSGFERNMVWIGTGKKYADLSHVSGANSPNDSRAVIAADFDDDGDVDLFVHNIQRERHALYRNDAVVPGSKDARFLKVRLTATTKNPEAVGATVVVHGPLGPVAQAMARGSGFESCLPPELIFGLGSAEEARVEVLWPGGAREDFGTLAAGSRALLVEGSGKAVPYAAAPMELPDPLPPGLRLAEGDVVPRLRLRDAAGEERLVDLRELAGGKPLLLNLWASYCTPCVRELPDLQSIHERGEQRVVTLSVDVEADVPTAERLATRAGVTFPRFYAADEAAPDADAMGLAELVDLERLTLPTTLVLSAEGRVESILRGPLR